MLMDAPCLVPQAAVAAAAGAAALTAARLGASPDAVAGAVAAAVHSTWRWASPSAVQPHTSLPEECETDRVGVWFAHEGLGSAVQLEASDEPGGTAQLMDAQHRAPDEPGDEAQLMDPLFGRAAQFAGLEELGSAAQFEASDEPDNAVQLMDLQLSDAAQPEVGDVPELVPNAVLDRTDGHSSIGVKCGRILQAYPSDASTADTSDAAPHVEDFEALDAAAHLGGHEEAVAHLDSEAREAGPHVEGIEALQSMVSSEDFVPSDVLDAAELPRPPEADDAFLNPATIDWDALTARLVALMSVDMGAGPLVWSPGHPGLHKRTIDLFQELGELKKGHDAGCEVPSCRLATAVDECESLEALCVDPQAAPLATSGCDALGLIDVGIAGLAARQTKRKTRSRR